MIVAVHQPNYLPWIGFFHKIAASNVFVLLDTVQFPRGSSVANRNRIKTAHGVQYLIVPVSIPKGRQGKVLYKEVQTAGSHWKKQHLKSIRMAYGRAPYFSRYFDKLGSILEKGKSLLEMNLMFIEFCLVDLQIDTRIELLSGMDVEPAGKSRLIANICRQLGSNTYLSGQGARKYNDEQIFARMGIRLTYQEFNCPKYPQLHGEFVPNLSIVDLLFNCGPQSGEVLDQGLE